MFRLKKVDFWQLWAMIIGVLPFLFLAAAVVAKALGYWEGRCELWER